MPGPALPRNQNDPTDFKSVVRVVLHYIEIEQCQCQCCCTLYKIIAAPGRIGKIPRGERISFLVLCPTSREKGRSLAQAAESLEISRDSQTGVDVSNGWLPSDGFPSDARIDS